MTTRRTWRRFLPWSREARAGRLATRIVKLNNDSQISDEEWQRQTDELYDVAIQQKVLRDVYLILSPRYAGIPTDGPPGR